MAGIPKNVKSLLFPPIGVRAMAICAFVLEMLALPCLIMGIISSVKDDRVGLWSPEWFMITVVLFIYGLWWWLTAYFAAKEE